MRLALRVLVLLVASITVGAQTPAPGATTAAAPAKSGVIRGRILAADTGRPLRRAQITLNGPERRTTNTGLDGRYEFKELGAGRYTVAASRSGYLRLEHGQRRPLEQARPLDLSAEQTMEGVDFTLPRMGRITGRVLDDAGEPMAGVTVQALRPAYVEGRRQLVIVAMTSGFQGTDDTGVYQISGLTPGTYYLRAMTRETWMSTASGRRELLGFKPTYFPSTPEFSGARAVDVGVGQRVTDADIPLVIGRPATISGVAVDSQGRPLAGRSVGLGQRFLRELPGGGGSSAGSTPVLGDGRFVFKNVTPGEYQLSIFNGELGTAAGEYGLVHVTVDGADLENVVVATSAGWSIGGRFVTEDGLVPDFPRDRVSVRGLTLNQMAVAGANAVQVNDDWTFSVRTLIGPARLVVTVPDGWMVKAVRHHDRDIMSSMLELRSGEQLQDVEIVLSNRVTRVSGQLNDDRGRPVTDGTVVMFADDPERWGENSAFVRIARPDQQGRYEIRGLPGGDYLAVALDYLQNGAWNDPEFLESLRRDARRVTIADGASQSVSLRVSEVP
jgi:hypothetical protein